MIVRDGGAMLTAAAILAGCAMASPSGDSPPRPQNPLASPSEPGEDESPRESSDPREPKDDAAPTRDAGSDTTGLEGVTEPEDDRTSRSRRRSKPSPTPEVSTPEPATPTLRPWSTPHVSSPAAPRLDHRYPSNYCAVFAAPPGTSVTIDRLDVGESEFSPDPSASPPPEEEPPPDGLAVLGMTLDAKPCPEDGDVACAEGNTITETSGCGLWPRHEGPTHIGTYTMILTWHLSTVCLDETAAACQGLEVAPDADRPVVAEWRVSTPLCAANRNYEPRDYDYDILNCG